MPAIVVLVLAVADWGVPSPHPEHSVTVGLLAGAAFIAVGMTIVGLTALSSRRADRQR